MRTWLITGCSSGFGKAIAAAALADGHRVAATARKPDDVAELVAPYDGSQALALRLDVTDPDQTATAVESVRRHFGSIDVLVNNAGISYFGGVEESDEHAVRRLFEINFFGLMRMTNAVLPHMREQRAGTIVNMASIAGLNGFASVGYYSASKFAVEGVSEALAQEIRPFGIRILLVEPSGFRTDWARSASKTQSPIAAYDTTPLRRQVDSALNSGALQNGNPTRAARAIIDDVLRDGPNLHLPLVPARFRPRWPSSARSPLNTPRLKRWRALRMMTGQEHVQAEGQGAVQAPAFCRSRTSVPPASRTRTSAPPRSAR